VRAAVAQATHFGRRFVSHCAVLVDVFDKTQGSNMHTKLLIAVSAVAAALSSVVPASSQPIPGGPVAEAEMIGMHQLCDRGDRQACIRFGVMLGRAEEHHAEWRRSHPDWWGWEHH
jgi:hypothetical protein